ncbi:MAG: hypothetical protein WCK35_26800 [Chloroflexota bacterium]
MSVFYFQELGLTYRHPLPLFKAPSDAGEHGAALHAFPGFANFSESPQFLTASVLYGYAFDKLKPLHGACQLSTEGWLSLEPYDFW